MRDAGYFTYCSDGLAINGTRSKKPLTACAVADDEAVGAPIDRTGGNARGVFGNNERSICRDRITAFRDRGEDKQVTGCDINWLDEERSQERC